MKVVVVVVVVEKRLRKRGKKCSIRILLDDWLLVLFETEYAYGQNEEEDNPSHRDDVPIEHGRLGQIEATNENVTERFHRFGLGHGVGDVAEEGDHGVHWPEDARDEAEHELRARAQHQRCHLVGADGRQHQAVRHS